MLYPILVGGILDSQSLHFLEGAFHESRIVFPAGIEAGVFSRCAVPGIAIEHFPVSKDPGVSPLTQFTL